MKHSFFLLLLFIGCSTNQKSEYYFYDNDNIFKIDTVGSMMFYSINIPVFSFYNDTNKVEISSKGYSLLHFLKDESNEFKDTMYSKHVSVLDSIEYYDSVWLQDEENLIKFWDASMYEKGGKSDMLRIFLIERKSDSDSLIFKRVHRFYMPGREG